MAARTRQVTATIPNGQSLSGALAIGLGRIIGIIVNGAWTAAAISLEAGSSSTTGPVFHDDAEVTIASAAVVVGRYLSRTNLQGVRAPFVKLRSGTSGAAVAQVADRSITVFIEEG
jgi:hypothetical protein